ncbi:MAG: hypothetical protein JW963_25795 [Anaerolineales bacterium]|nr:hypothetical protein [Anaerolineales bacterium]
MTLFAFVFSVLMSTGSLAYAYNAAGFGMLARYVMVFAALWLFAGYKRWTWFSAIALLLSVALAGFGLWIELSPGWMISGALGGLLAWDLTEFMRRLRFAARTDDLRDLERRHLARVTIVALIGVALASIPMLVRLEFTFEWVVLLTLIATLGITQLVAWLRRGG